MLCIPIEFINPFQDTEFSALPSHMGKEGTKRTGNGAVKWAFIVCVGSGEICMANGFGNKWGINEIFTLIRVFIPTPFILKKCFNQIDHFLILSFYPVAHFCWLIKEPTDRIDLLTDRLVCQFRQRVRRNLNLFKLLQQPLLLYITVRRNQTSQDATDTVQFTHLVATRFANHTHV